jgi:hypothetical protein
MHLDESDSTVGIASIHVQASVHVEHLAGDEPRERGGEEGDRMAELVGLAEAPERDLGEQLAALRVVHLLELAALHERGRDGVHRDAVRRALAREREGERLQRGLRNAERAR